MVTFYCTCLRRSNIMTAIEDCSMTTCGVAAV